MQDLSNAGSLQTVTASHSTASLNPIANVVIGGGTSYPHAGLIDEVRISDTVLTAPDLLIEGFSFVPEPSTALLLGASLLGLGMVRRRDA